MNFDPVLRKRFLKIKRAYFGLFVYLYCKEKAKQSSIVQLGKSIEFKLCFKWICLSSVLDHFLKSILIDLKRPLWALKMSIHGNNIWGDYKCVLKFMPKIDFSLNIIIICQETNHIKLCNRVYISCWKLYRILRWFMSNVCISDQQQHHYLGGLLEMQTLRPSPDHLSQNLCFIQILRWFVNAFKFEKHHSM